MTTPSRNDPCPCGSGKKYKKCCLLNVEQNDFEYRRQRQIEADLIPRLFDFAFEVLDPNAIHDAWIEFNDDEEVDELTDDDPMNMFFMPWFFFNCLIELAGESGGRPFDSDVTKEDDEPSFETTIGELFLETFKEDLSPDQQAFLRSSILTPYTFCEVVEVRPGVGMTLRDLLREREFDVIEHSASRTLNRGAILYCAPAELRQITSNVATSPYPLGAIYKHEVLELRKELNAEVGHSTLNDDDLLAFESDIRGVYLDLLAMMFAPPSLVNTDQDPWLAQKVYFDLDSVDEAFHKLKDLAGSEHEDELLERATLKRNRVIAAEIPWIGGAPEGQIKLGGPILLGVLNLKDGQLVADVNSTNRAEQIRALVEKRLGDRARYKMTLITPVEGMIEELWEQAINRPDAAERTRKATAGAGEKEGDSVTAPAGAKSDPNSAEIQSLMKQLAAQHWSTWFDIPVPALNDMTPREAAATAEGRDLLESLLLHYESESERVDDDLLKPDIAAMRRELGMK